MTKKKKTKRIVLNIPIDDITIPAISIGLFSEFLKNKMYNSGSSMKSYGTKKEFLNLIVIESKE